MNAQHGKVTFVQPEQLIGQMLCENEYLVQRLLWQGERGGVYLAVHTTLSIHLVLKQVRADQPLPESVLAELNEILHSGNTPRRADRYALVPSKFPGSGGVCTDHFLREALLLARLHHMSIPTLYDYFFENGYWYLVIDYSAGCPLNVYLREKVPLPALEALGYALQLCNVIAYLHEQVPPIIYRALQPAHILLQSDGSLLLLDFGSACYIHDQQADEGSRSSVSECASLAESQEDGHADARSDLYSLGMLLQEMLCGEHAATTEPEAQNTQPSWPATVSILLRGLVHLATRVEPEQGFQSAHTFLLALERAYRVEEQQSYQTAVFVGTAMAGEEVRQMHKPLEGFVSSAMPLSDPQLRLRMREALQQARHERLLQAQLDNQLASVDESLKRRLSIPLSRPSPSRDEKVAVLQMRPAHSVNRFLKTSFWLALLLFVLLASSLAYERIGHPSEKLSPSNALRTSLSVSSTATFEPSPSPSNSYWQSLPSLPAPQADNTATYVTVRGRSYIYMSGGYRSPEAPSYDRHLYRYDIETARWEDATALHMPGMVNNVAAVDEQGHIFFTAGYSSDTYTVPSLLYMYQPENDILQKIVLPVQMPVGFGGAMLTDHLGHVYLTQGFLHAGDPNVRAGTGWYRYDITSGQWHMLAPLPVGLGYVALSLNSSGDIFMLGGALDAGQHLQKNSVYRYDSMSNIWSQEPAMPQVISGAASCTVLPDQLMIVGGYAAAAHKGLTQAWLFDEHALHWQALPTVPGGGSVLGAAACDNDGHAYLVRGASDSSQPTQDFLELIMLGLPATADATNH